MPGQHSLTLAEQHDTATTQRHRFTEATHSASAKDWEKGRLKQALRDDIAERPQHGKRFKQLMAGGDQGGGGAHIS